MAKIQPAQTKLFFRGSIDALNGSYIDIAQCLSFVNRRQYEQGKCYYVEHIKTVSNPLSDASANYQLTFCDNS